MCLFLLKWYANAYVMWSLSFCAIPAFLNCWDFKNDYSQLDHHAKNFSYNCYCDCSWVDKMSFCFGGRQRPLQSQVASYGDRVNNFAYSSFCWYCCWVGEIPFRFGERQRLWLSKLASYADFVNNFEHHRICCDCFWWMRYRPAFLSHASLALHKFQAD